MNSLDINLIDFEKLHHDMFEYYVSYNNFSLAQAYDYGLKKQNIRKFALSKQEYVDFIRLLHKLGIWRQDTIDSVTFTIVNKPL